MKEEEPIEYHLSFYHIYEVIIRFLGRELDADAGTKGNIGFRDFEEVDDILNEKNYPIGFRLETLFDQREVPGGFHQ